jgi:hypothetical protein
MIRHMGRELQHLPSEITEEVRREASYVFRHANPRKQNTSKTKRHALKVLGNDVRITILQEDESVFRHWQYVTKTINGKCRQC